MDRIADSLRELVAALGLQGRAAEIEAEASSLLAVHDGIVEAEVLAKQRPENNALAACYIAANYLLLPERISYEAMCKAAAQTTSWRTEPAPSKSGMTKLVKRFARRICPVDHEPEIVERGGMVFAVCTLHSFDPDEPSEGAASMPGQGGMAGELATARPGAPDEAPADELVVEDASKRMESSAFAGVTPDISKKWLASAAVQAKKYAKQFPALKPAVPGAARRPLGTYIFPSRMPLGAAKTGRFITPRPRGLLITSKALVPTSLISILKR